jgi:hypothetical protein
MPPEIRREIKIISPKSQLCPNVTMEVEGEVLCED